VAKGTLYLVATPIGNLGDMTLRGIETLRAVDYVASEDTRKTGRLLQHFEIGTPQIAFHEHNERQATGRIVNLLRGGQSVALVTDAGTPGISDPGFTLVRAVLATNAEGVEVGLTMIPGPTGLIMALVLSGLPLHSFTFRGFPPRKGGPRQRFLAVDQVSPHTLVFYESPYRLAALLQDALTVYGDRPAALANDLTKLYERVTRGRLSTLVAATEKRTLKGEYIVVIAGKDVEASWEMAENVDDETGDNIDDEAYDEADDKADDKADEELR
jgi:16S rRNA (cytidine1402-2'-O)-methyltransferase